MYVKVRYEGDEIHEEIWEAETQLKLDYPELFLDDI